MREREIERVLCNEVKKLGGKAYKWVSPGNNGVPDRIIILPNKPVVFVELKTDAGKLTTLQKSQIHTLEKLGQQVQVLYGMDGVSQFFYDMGFRNVSVALDKKYKTLEVQK